MTLYDREGAVLARDSYDAMLTLGVPLQIQTRDGQRITTEQLREYRDPIVVLDVTGVQPPDRRALLLHEPPPRCRAETAAGHRCTRTVWNGAMDGYCTQHFWQHAR